LRWDAIQALYDPECIRHGAMVTAAGLEIPLNVFERLFHERHGDSVFEPVVQEVDWSRIAWTEAFLTGASLRSVRVPRPYQHAVDEARASTAAAGLEDERPEVLAHWRTAGTWMVPPVVVAGSAIGSRPGDELIVGFTRLGNLLGLLDRGEVPANARHQVWLGRKLA
jgi:hypothetical protein